MKKERKKKEEKEQNRLERDMYEVRFSDSVEGQRDFVSIVVLGELSAFSLWIFCLASRSFRHACPYTLCTGCHFEPASSLHSSRGNIRTQQPLLSIAIHHFGDQKLGFFFHYSNFHQPKKFSYMYYMFMGKQVYTSIRLLQKHEEQQILTCKQGGEEYFPLHS